jgi:hypothetical protein
VLLYSIYQCVALALPWLGTKYPLFPKRVTCLCSSYQYSYRSVRDTKSLNLEPRKRLLDTPLALNAAYTKYSGQSPGLDNTILCYNFAGKIQILNVHLRRYLNNIYYLRFYKV